MAGSHASCSTSMLASIQLAYASASRHVRLRGWVGRAGAELGELPARGSAGQPATYSSATVSHSSLNSLLCCTALRSRRREWWFGCAVRASSASSRSSTAYAHARSAFISGRWRNLNGVPAAMSRPAAAAPTPQRRDALH